MICLHSRLWGVCLWPWGLSAFIGAFSTSPNVPGTHRLEAGPHLEPLSPACFERGQQDTQVRILQQRTQAAMSKDPFLNQQDPATLACDARIVLVGLHCHRGWDSVHGDREGRWGTGQSWTISVVGKRGAGASVPFFQKAESNGCTGSTCAITLIDVLCKIAHGTGTELKI